MRKNRKKIKVCILMAVIFLAAAVALATWLISNNLPADATPQDLYTAVMTYDYSKGHSKEIEDRIAKELENTIEPFERIPVLKAKAEYYLNLYKYHTTLSVLDELSLYSGDSGDSRIYVVDLYIKTYQGIGNDAKVEEYSEEYDRLTKKCGE